MEEKNNLLEKLLSKSVNREIIYYLIFGALTTLINLVVYKLCTSIDIVYWISNIIAWIIALIFAFITNKLFVFESKTTETGIVFKEAISFVCGRLFSGLCDLSFMIFAVELIDMNDFVAKIITNFFVVFINYIVSKLIVFKNVRN